MLSIGVAIPCYHGHITVLKNLLDNIENQTRKPDMVVVSCSGTETIPYRQEDYSYPLKFILTKNKLNSAQNRNIAANNLNTDIVSFIDADDQMYPQRLEIIEKAFKENNIVLFVNRFVVEKNTPTELYNINDIVFDINKLGMSPVGDGCIHFTNQNANIHNGHCSVSKHIFNYIKFRESPKSHGREDSDFIIDILNLYPRHTAYCPVPLTIYFSSGTLSFAT